MLDPPKLLLSSSLVYPRLTFPSPAGIAADISAISPVSPPLSSDHSTVLSDHFATGPGADDNGDFGPTHTTRRDLSDLEPEKSTQNKESSAPRHQGQAISTPFSSARYGPANMYRGAIEQSEFPNFLDPFLDWPSQQMAEFACPPLDDDFLTASSPFNRMMSSDTGLLSEARNAQHTRNPVPDGIQGSPPVPLQTAARGTSIIDAVNRTSDEVVPPDINTDMSTSSPNASIPHIIKHKSNSAVITFTEEMHQNLLRDVSTHMLQDNNPAPSIPAAKSLEKYLRTYFEVFQIHMPIFHQSFDMVRAPAPLVLAMCAIGAVYRMERKAAAILFNQAHQAFGNFDHLVHSRSHSNMFLAHWITSDDRSHEIEETPLWASQTMLLLTIFAAWSGDTMLVSQAIADLGFFARVSANKMLQIFISESSPRIIERDRYGSSLTRRE